MFLAFGLSTSDKCFPHSSFLGRNSHAWYFREFPENVNEKVHLRKDEGRFQEATPLPCRINATTKMNGELYEEEPAGFAVGIPPAPENPADFTQAATSTGKELKSWERPWSLSELRRESKWTLAADAGVNI